MIGDVRTGSDAGGGPAGRGSRRDGGHPVRAGRCVERLGGDAQLVGAPSGRHDPGSVAAACPVPVGDRVRRSRRQRPGNQLRPGHRKVQRPGTGRGGRGADGAGLPVGDPVHGDHHGKSGVHVQPGRPEGLGAGHARADVHISERRAADHRWTRLPVGLGLRRQRYPGQRDHVRSDHERRPGGHLAWDRGRGRRWRARWRPSASSPAIAPRRRSIRRPRPARRR